MASINNTWPGAIIFCLVYKKYIVYKFFNMTMHYPQWNYITVPSFMFRCVTVSELRLFKRKKKKNLQNGLLLI